jgi:hypothetical protein
LLRIIIFALLKYVNYEIKDYTYFTGFDDFVLGGGWGKVGISRIFGRYDAPLRMG